MSEMIGFFPSAPISYTVELTHNCANQCPGCANAWKYSINETSNWKTLFDRIAPPKNRSKFVELIRLSGGEPTLHSQFYEIIQYIDTFSIPHALFTSARWKNPEEIILHYQKLNNFVGMLISLHGSTASTHNAFIGNHSDGFKETCSNIKKASAAGLDVFTNTVLTKHACGEVQNIIHLSQSLGASYAVFNRFLSKENHPIQPSDSQLHETVLLIEDLHKKGTNCRIGNCIPKCFVENSSEGANAGIEHCSISPDGWVRPDNLTRFAFGNIFDQPIEDIWRSESANLYRRQINELCLDCVEISRCRGGEKSLAIEYSLENDHLMREPIYQNLKDPIILDPQAKIFPNFKVKNERFGYLLTRYNWSVPVSSDAKPLIDEILNRPTISSFYAQYGDDALNLIIQLYKEGCVNLCK